jgi:uncharacterized membrane protein YagU involved in acid resistance
MEIEVPPMIKTSIRLSVASPMAASRVDGWKLERDTQKMSMRSTLTAILMGGLIAGTIDIGSACLINGRAPAVILRVIASGLSKDVAFADGLPIWAIGLILQWTMSILIATIFVAASQWAPILRRRWIVAGLVYGVIVFFFMNYVVMPLSAIGYAPRFRMVHFSQDMVAMLLFGLIVAYFARRANQVGSATIQHPAE